MDGAPPGARRRRGAGAAPAAGAEVQGRRTSPSVQYRMPGAGEGAWDTATPRSGAADAVEVVDLDWRTPVVGVAAVIAVGATAALVRSTPRTLTWLVIGACWLALNRSWTASRTACGAGAASPSRCCSSCSWPLAVIGIVLGPETVRQARSLQRRHPRRRQPAHRPALVGRTLADNDVPTGCRTGSSASPTASPATSPRWPARPGRWPAGRSPGSPRCCSRSPCCSTASAWELADRRLLPAERRLRPTGGPALLLGDRQKYFAGSVLVAVLQGLAVLVVA